MKFRKEQSAIALKKKMIQEAAKKEKMMITKTKAKDVMYIKKTFKVFRGDRYVWIRGNVFQHQKLEKVQGMPPQRRDYPFEYYGGYGYMEPIEPHIPGENIKSGHEQAVRTNQKKKKDAA